MVIHISKYIFDPDLLQKKLESISITQIEFYKDKLKLINHWISLINSGEIYKRNEKSLQGDFFTLFFTNVLGYRKMHGNLEWNIMQEEKTDYDGTVPDGVLGFFSSNKKTVHAVVELKGANTDLDKKQKVNSKFKSAVDQAFNYSYKYKGKCNWVIISNLLEIRLYHALDILRYEVFKIENLLQEREFTIVGILIKIETFKIL